MVNQYLVLVETPSIKKYVFGTDKLKEIRGASAILDELNRVLTFDTLKNVFGESAVHTLYANGGSGQFLITCTDDSIDRAATALEHLYATATKGAARVLVAYAPYTGSYFQASRDARYNLQAKRDQQGMAIAKQHSPFFKDCSSCSDGVATEKDPIDMDDWLCEACNTKRKAGKEKLLVWKEFCEYLRDQGAIQDETEAAFNELRPDSFKTIGELSNSYIGLVYADGNAMSKHIMAIQQTDRSDAFKRFSENIDRSIRTACYEALAATCPLDTTVSGKVIPADILILGGDDLVVVMPADRAITFAVKVSERFTELTREAFQDDDLLADILGLGASISIGIAIGKHTHPFRILLDQAEELLALAKQAGSENAQNEPNPGGPDEKKLYPSYIDIHVSTQSSQLGVEKVRDSYYRAQVAGDVLHRTMRPFTVDEVKTLQAAIRQLSRYPRSKLHRLYEAAFLSKNTACLETISIFTRSEHEREQLKFALDSFGCFSLMPWRSEGGVFKTIVPDIVELFDFAGDA